MNDRGVLDFHARGDLGEGKHGQVGESGFEEPAEGEANGRGGEDDRRQALALPRALEAGRSAHVLGSDPVAAARGALNGLEPDYVELFDLDGVTLLAAAARVGSTRLIDNIILEGDLT